MRFEFVVIRRIVVDNFNMYEWGQQAAELFQARTFLPNQVLLRYSYVNWNECPLLQFNLLISLA